MQLPQETQGYVRRIEDYASHHGGMSMPDTTLWPAGPPGRGASGSELHVIVTTKGQPGTSTQVRGAPGLRVSQRDQTNTAMGAASATGS